MQHLPVITLPHCTVGNWNHDALFCRLGQATHFKQHSYVCFISANVVYTAYGTQAWNQTKIYSLGKSQSIH